MSTLSKVAELIAENAGVDAKEITMDTTFEELGLDSLDAVDLVMACEEQFSVTIEMDEALKTVGDVVRLIDSQKA
ncbi:MAG TPA: acyl carrier protein [Clostridiales bacterium]|nr:acyl carrier protein [Clostridiales bacterium]